MREQVVINQIEKWLKYKHRYFDNIHGSVYGKDGTPDILSIDANGQYLGIEAKAPGHVPRVNQIWRAMQILKSGGRVIVAYPDFDLNKVDAKVLPTIEIHDEEQKINSHDKTFEFVMLGDDDHEDGINSNNR